MSRSQVARQLFLDGANCAQAVLCAFCDETGLDKETSMKIASSFGGGMGRMREVCGACSGMFMAAGLIFGYTDLRAQEEKREHYELIQRLAALFREQNGSIICRELLAGIAVESGSAPEERNEGYYRKRPCAEYVADAAAILDEVLAGRDLALIDSMMD